MTRESIESIRAEVEALKCRTQKEIEEARVRLLGKKGEITALFDEFRTIDKELKKEFGKTLTELKTIAQTKIEEMKSLVGIEDGGEAGAGLLLVLSCAFRRQLVEGRAARLRRSDEGRTFSDAVPGRPRAFRRGILAAAVGAPQGGGLQPDRH